MSDPTDMGEQEFYEKKIKHLESEVERLTEKLKRIEQYGLPPLSAFHSLEAERDRYKEALEKIEHLPDFVAADSYTDKRSMQDAMAVANYAYEIASEALKHPEE